MNQYQLVEAMMLKIADAMTTTRLGLVDGRITMPDTLDNMKNIKLAVTALELYANNEETMTDDEQNEMQSLFDSIVMG